MLVWRGSFHQTSDEEDMASEKVLLLSICRGDPRLEPLMSVLLLH